MGDIDIVLAEERESLSGTGAAEIEFTLDRILSGRITKFATLKSGEWPKDSELVRMADGGGEHDGGLGGSVLEMPDGRKLVTIYTD